MKSLHRIKRIRRQNRIRARIQGTATRPRLSVFRSGKYLFVQLIDDERGKTLVAASDKKIGTTQKMKEGGAKVIRAFSFGKQIAEAAKAKGIACAVFDRGGYAYHGRVKALAEGAREGGLQI